MAAVVVVVTVVVVVAVVAAVVVEDPALHPIPLSCLLMCLTLLCT